MSIPGDVRHSFEDLSNLYEDLVAKTEVAEELLEEANKLYQTGDKEKIKAALDAVFISVSTTYEAFETAKEALLGKTLSTESVTLLLDRNLNVLLDDLLFGKTETVANQVINKLKNAIKTPQNVTTPPQTAVPSTSTKDGNKSDIRDQSDIGDQRDKAEVPPSPKLSEKTAEIKETTEETIIRWETEVKTLDKQNADTFKQEVLKLKKTVCENIENAKGDAVGPLVVQLNKLNEISRQIYLAKMPKLSYGREFLSKNSLSSKTKEKPATIEPAEDTAKSSVKIKYEDLNIPKTLNEREKEIVRTIVEGNTVDILRFALDAAHSDDKETIKFKKPRIIFCFHPDKYEAKTEEFKKSMEGLQSCAEAICQYLNEPQTKMMDSPSLQKGKANLLTLALALADDDEALANQLVFDSEIGSSSGYIPMMSKAAFIFVHSQSLTEFIKKNVDESFQEEKLLKNVGKYLHLDKFENFFVKEKDYKWKLSLDEKAEEWSRGQRQARQFLRRKEEAKKVEEAKKA